MGIMGVLLYLVVFISVLALSSAQTSTTATTTSTISTTSGIQWPESLYPFGTAAGDTQTLVAGDESFVGVGLSSPFMYFGRSYGLIYVNNNGLLSFNQAIPEAAPYIFPSGGEDLIAGLWTELDDYGLGAFYYHEYTSGDVLTRATDDIKRYYPGVSFSATWVFVTTWDFVETFDQNVFRNRSAPSITAQVVLISDGTSSFILMNYGDISSIGFQVEAGYDTVGSTHYFVIPNSNDGNLISNLKTSSNVNLPGRWAFSANQGLVQFTETFYPVGLAAGDAQTVVIGTEDYVPVYLSSPFLYFGRSYGLIYVNNNGLLSLSREIPEAHPFPFPSGGEDLIAGLWTELDDYGYGAFYYHEYTSGDVLTRATDDIKRYYPGVSFNATWVFVTTWDFIIQSYDPYVYLHHSVPSISFQVVLISDGSSSFILMNYGDIGAVWYPVEAGYDTVGSTHYFVIPNSNDGNLLFNLKTSSNVNVPGRWAFSANQGLVQFTETFYPVGLAAGDAQTVVIGTEDYVPVYLSSPFQYFGRSYGLIYVNNNGLLSLSREIPEAHPFPFPSGGEDLIAGLWTELDDYGYGTFYYHEYTSGDVLTRATDDIKRYYPGVSFSATWVFIATWDFIIQSYDPYVYLHHSVPSISFQVVLISDGSSSFILMNYGDIGVVWYPVEAGYDTVGSTHYFVIPNSNDGNLLFNLKTSSNVNVPGRWAFSANQGIVQFTETFYPVGLAAGDAQTVVIGTEDYVPVYLSSPFQYFGRSYGLIYVNNNGLISFNQAIPEAEPYIFPSGGEDLIAGLWTDLDDYGYGTFYYHEYTSGDVLTRATDDIKRYYPGVSFSATWVFVTTWDFIITTYDPNVYLHRLAPSISFQVVLISDGSSSFILMNYGDIGYSVETGYYTAWYSVEAGYDTVGSTHYFVIPNSNDGNLISNLKTSSNVNVPGRWAFSANQGLVQFTENFYPVGAGDSQTLVFAAESVAEVHLSRPFVFFGHAYNRLFVNYNGLLSFSQGMAEVEPIPFPSHGGDDFIAPLWNDLDDFGFGILYYQEYTSGGVLARATQDINQYYPDLSFSATWVFVTTWDFVQGYDANVFYHRLAPSITVQTVLISDGGLTFVLMNYGDISVFGGGVQVGYDTVGSTHHFVVPGSNDWNSVPYLKNTTNVNVPGRWAFLVNQENIIGLQMKVTSTLDLMDNGNMEFLLNKLKQELVIRGLPSNVRLTKRRVQKTNN